MFRPAQTRHTFEDVVEQIAEAIQSGDIRPGDRLPSERTLAEQMQISRPTLREAIRVLSKAGVVGVKSGAGGGMYVSSDRMPVEVLTKGIKIKISEVSNVLETRRMLEPRVAQLAALRATEADFEAMQETIDLQRQRPIDDVRFVQLDIRFHTAIARATQNETVVELMRTMLRRLWLVRQTAMRSEGDLEIATQSHVDTLAAIRSGDPDAVATAMDAHLGFLEERWAEETGRAHVRRIPDFLLPLAGSSGG